MTQQYPRAATASRAVGSGRAVGRVLNSPEAGA